MEWLWIVLAVLVLLLLGWLLFGRRSGAGDERLGGVPGPVPGGTGTHAGGVAGPVAGTGLADLDRPRVDPDAPAFDERRPHVPAADVDAPATSREGLLDAPDASPATGPDAGAEPDSSGVADEADVETGRPTGAATFADTSPAPAASTDLAAGEATLGRSLSTDDLTLVEGIGPAIATLLGDGGIRTWDDLSAASPADLRTVLDAGGSQFNIHDPETWPEQAQLALRGEWDQLSELQERLRGGQR